MGVRKSGPRLSLAEIRGLRRSIQHLAAVNGMLQRTSWQGAPAAIASIGIIWEELARVYNRREPWLPRAEWLGGAEPASSGLPAPTAALDVSLERSADPIAHEEE